MSEERQNIWAQFMGQAPAEPDHLAIQKMETRLAREQVTFREACDAAFVEGTIARQVGAPLDADPYVGEEPASICPHVKRSDLWGPWALGWREADERWALDELIVAAVAATNQGRTVPACPAGNMLREAVEAYLARQVGNR